LLALCGGYDPGTVRSRAPLVTAAALAVVLVAACSPGHAVSGAGSQRPPTVAATAPGAQQAPATPSAAAGHAAPSAFRASVTRLGPSWRWRLRYTWHRGCPQPLSGLALIHLTYWGFDQRAHPGELIVNAAVTGKIITVFAVLYRARYQIRKMVLPDVYQGSDPRSTNADNTSAFNCRLVDGTNDWSMHAYGLAVDINPCENVYIESGQVDPPRCTANADRSRHVPGLIHEGGVVTQAFGAIGWGVGRPLGHAQGLPALLQQRALTQCRGLGSPRSAAGSKSSPSQSGHHHHRAPPPQPLCGSCPQNAASAPGGGWRRSDPYGSWVGPLLPARASKSAPFPIAEQTGGRAVTRR
jgi:hypothetical protein